LSKNHTCVFPESNFWRRWPIFLMNDNLVIAVLCFGSHICNKAARIRVKPLPFSLSVFFLSFSSFSN
jgi:hypothetical protein